MATLPCETKRKSEHGKVVVAEVEDEVEVVVLVVLAKLLVEDDVVDTVRDDVVVEVVVEWLHVLHNSGHASRTVFV